MYVHLKKRVPAYELAKLSINLNLFIYVLSYFKQESM